MDTVIIVTFRTVYLVEPATIVINVKMILFLSWTGCVYAQQDIIYIMVVVYNVMYLIAQIANRLIFVIYVNQPII